MVKFVAYKSEDTRDLSELGLFQNIKKNLDRKGEGKSFDATKGDIDMHVTGKAMLFVLKNPVSGTMKSVDVDVHGADRYKVSGLDIKLRKMKDFFKGDYESKIFSGKDTLNGSSESDKLFGFAGNDTINGNNGADTINGGDGNDQLYGGAGADSMAGGKGNDLLDGGAGANKLTGNSGDDSFRFSAQLNKNNYSTITDFTIGSDTIELQKTSFPGLSGKGTLKASQFVKATDYDGQKNVVVYYKSTGELAYETTGGSLSDAVKFGEVTAGLKLSNTDFLIV